MRSLELTLTLITLVVALRDLRGRRPRGAIGTLLGAMPAAAALVQVVVEGPRWQLLPIWVAAGGLLLRAMWQTTATGRASGGPGLAPRSPDEPASRWPALTATTLTVVSGLLLWALPVIEFPDLAGPYAVGTSTAFLTDEQRMEIYGPDPGTLRQLPVQVWYPAEPVDDARPTPWLADRPHLTTAAAREAGFPGFALDHLSLVESHAVTDAPIVRDGPFPVVVYAHGWRGFRDIHASQLESLASRGYVVVAADHTYAALATVLAGGVTADLDPDVLPSGVPAEDYDQAATRLVETVAADLEVLLDAILDGQILPPALAQAVDGDRVALIGHSTGGGAAYLLCSRDRRCGAAVGYDPWVEPIPDEVIGGMFDRPLLSLGSQEWAGTDNDARLRRLHAGAMDDEGRVRIDGTLHRDLTLLPTLSPVASWVGSAGSTPAWDTLAILDEWTVGFLDHHLSGRTRDPLLEPIDDARVQIATNHHADAPEEPGA